MPKTEAPRQPTREDKRRIMAELQEVYLGEDRGYASGKSDDTVAKDLNLPRAWVSDIREDFFGPHKNEMQADFIEEVRSVEKTHKAIEDEIENVMVRASELGKTIARLTKAADKIEETMK